MPAPSRSYNITAKNNSSLKHTIKPNTWTVPHDGYCLYNALWNWAVDNYTENEQAEKVLKKCVYYAKKNLENLKEIIKNKQKNFYFTETHANVLLDQLNKIANCNPNNLKKIHQQQKYEDWFNQFGAILKLISASLLNEKHYTKIYWNNQKDVIQSALVDNRTYETLNSLDNLHKMIIENGLHSSYQNPINDLINHSLIAYVTGQKAEQAGTNLVRYGIKYESEHFSYTPKEIINKKQTFSTNTPILRTRRTAVDANTSPQIPVPPQQIQQGRKELNLTLKMASKKSNKQKWDMLIDAVSGSETQRNEALNLLYILINNTNCRILAKKEIGTLTKEDFKRNNLLLKQAFEMYKTQIKLQKIFDEKPKAIGYNKP